MIDHYLQSLPHFSINLSYVALSLLGLFIAFNIGVRVNYERKLKKTGGVHGSYLATNGFTCIVLSSAISSPD